MFDDLHDINPPVGDSHQLAAVAERARRIRRRRHTGVTTTAALALIAGGVVALAATRNTDQSIPDDASPSASTPSTASDTSSSIASLPPDDGPAAADTAASTSVALPSTTAAPRSLEVVDLEGETETADPEIRYPTEEEVGRAPASSDDVTDTIRDFEIRKLAATGVGADDRDWWATTWSRTFESGATVFCVGSPTGAACRDDAYLPSPTPVTLLSIGGWPPEFMALVDAEVTVSDVKIDNESVRFDQVPLDIPSRRSIVAIPLPNRSVEISVSFVAEGRQGTLDVPYTAEFAQTDPASLPNSAQFVIEYGPTPGMQVGDTTSETG